MFFWGKKKIYSISIGITTFENRFEKYFLPLISKLREFNEDTEIIVAVNGEHNRTFGEDYRKQMLKSLSCRKNVYPVFFPRFRGLSKLWNTIIIHSTADHILLLNDDVMITAPGFMDKINKYLNRNGGRSFLINKSWSHCVISREEIDIMGYFDERLLGIGEEDGDMTWRYINRFKRPIANYAISEFINYSEDTVDNYKPINIKCHSNSKYSLFNRKFMFDRKYKPDINGIKGMFDQPQDLIDPGNTQYPNEKFYHMHKDEL